MGGGGVEGVEVGRGRGRHCPAFRRMVTPGPEKSSERATMFSGTLSLFGLHSRVHARSNLPSEPRVALTECTKGKHTVFNAVGVIEY